MTEPSERERSVFEAFRRYGLPILGVVETIATKGASPGTTAMGVEQVFQQQEDRRRKFLQEERNRQNTVGIAALLQILKNYRKSRGAPQAAQNLFPDMRVSPQKTTEHFSI